jgi:hypothetical protein
LPSPAENPAAVKAGDALADLYALTTGMREPEPGVWAWLEKSGEVETIAGFLEAASEELSYALGKSLTSAEQELLDALVELEQAGKEAELAENKFAQRQQLLARRNVDRIAAGKEPRIFLGDGRYWNKLKNTAEERIRKVQTQMEKILKSQSKITGYQSKIQPAKALAYRARQLATAASFINALVLGNELAGQLKKGKLEEAAKTFTQLLPSACALGEAIVAAKFKELAKKVLPRLHIAGAALTGAAAIVDCVDLWMKDDIDAAVGRFISGSAVVAGCFATGIAGAMGVSVFPLALVIAVVGLIGEGIYLYCKDDIEVEFLKNNPWASNCRPIHARLAQGRITPEEDHLDVPEWKKALDILKPYLSEFCSPKVTLGTNGDAMYVSIDISNLMGAESWTVILDLTAESVYTVNAYELGETIQSGPSIKLEHRHIIGDTWEVNSPGRYFFEMLLDWKLIDGEVRALPDKQYSLRRIKADVKCSMEDDYPLEDRDFSIFLGKYWVNKTDRGLEALSTVRPELPKLSPV